MNLLGSYRSSKHFSLTAEENILIKKLLLCHDPDGRRLDSQQLLSAMENIMFYATSSEVSGLQFDVINNNGISDIEIVGSNEPLGHTIYKISHEILCKCSGEGDLHARTMLIFDFLGNYKWDAKVVLVLAAFATTYGEFWLLMQLYPRNPLAVWVAILKQLPSDISKLRPRFKALSLLVKTMVDVSKYIIKFEALPVSELRLDSNEAVTITKTKSHIYVAAYWVTRSALACSRQIKDLIAMKSEQVYSNSTTIAAWELSSLVWRLSSIYSDLKQQVDACHQLTEPKMHGKLYNLFQETHTGNQEVLRIFFTLKDDLPLKHCHTQAKCGVSELKDKVVIFFISKPELLPLEGLFFLVQQTDDHPYKEKSEGNYETVWIPISVHNTWTDSEKRIFHFLSNSLPWYSVRQPWQLNSAMINYIKQDWNYNHEPLMVVLNPQGKISHLNALDMISIWGSRAYPFSITREQQLWEEQNWTLELMINEIDPLFAKWVEEGRQICVYGSVNLDWIREFNSKMKVIKGGGVQLEMVYVGKRNPDEQVRDILATINEEMHSTLFSFTKIHFFWIRMESMRRSKLQLGKTASDDHVLEEVSGLLDVDNNDRGWAVIGRGSSADIVTLQGEKLLECLDKFPDWQDNVPGLGFSGAIRAALEPPIPAGPCNHSDLVPFDERLIEAPVVCQKCKRPMKKFVVYE